MKKYLDLIIGAVVVLVVGATLLLGVHDQVRRARDVARLAEVRSVQAGLETFRGMRASYPASIDAVPVAKDVTVAMAYTATPEGCAENRTTLCTGYALTFSLEGQVGALIGGSCTAGPQGVACKK